MITLDSSSRGLIIAEGFTVVAGYAQKSG